VIFNRVLIISSTVAGTGALLIALISLAINSETFQPIESLLGVLTFCSIAAGSGFTVIIEARLLRQKRYKWIVGRSVLTSVLSVALVVLSQVESRPLVLFISASGITAISGPIIWLTSGLREVHRFAIRPLPSFRGEIIRYLSVSWSSSLIGKGAMAFMPLLVALKVGSIEYSRFFIAWNIAMVMFLLVQNVSVALLADGGRTSPLEKQTRHALELATAIAAVITVATLVCTPLIQPVFGDEYGGSVKVLRILSLVAVAMAIYSVANAVAQVRGIPAAMICLPLVMTAGIYLPLVLISNITIEKAALSLLFGVAIAGCVGGIFLFVLRAHPFAATQLPSNKEH
jgi:hypothetical protein